MAIAFDAAVDGGFGGFTPLVFSHTCSGSNRILHVGAANDTGDFITGVTYNGVSMTLIAKVQIGSGVSWKYLYELINPASGAHSVSIGFSAGSPTGQAISHTGAQQSAQPDSFNTGSANNFSTQLDIATTVVASNCWLVGCFDASNGGMTGEVGTTVRVDEGSGGYRLLCDSNGVVGTGSQQLGVNVGSAALDGIVASIIPAAGGGGGVTLAQLEKGPTRGVLRGMAGRIIG